jgi:hypothetical protein
MERRQPVFQIKEQNFSGVTSLYRVSPHRTYVVEVELKKRIRGDMLQEAVNQTLQRMPYFADALTEKDGDFYYAVNPLPMEVAETKQLRRVGGPETNWHCVDVTWWENTVSFSMFHALCDGLGLNLFIESVIYHYFCIRDDKKYDAKGIRTVGSPILPGEETDPFAQTYPVAEDFNMASFADKYYHLPEADEKPTDRMLAMPVRIREDDFMRFVKENKGTPTAMLHILMSHAVQTVHPENEQMIGALIPASSRKLLGAENTFKNCVGALRLPYRQEEMDKLSLLEQTQRTREMLRESKNPDMARFLANQLGGAVRKVGAVMHTYAERQAVLDFSSKSNSDTYMIDYVGSLNAGEYASEIIKTRYLATNLTRNFNSMTIYLSATAGFFHLEVVRGFESSVYCDAFLEQLVKHGIAFERDAETSYITPQNGLIEGLGLI